MASASVTSTRSAGPVAAQRGDRLLDLDRVTDRGPSGVSIAVSSALVRTPCASPRSTIVRASCRAESRSRMKAPLPTLTSSTSDPVPSAIFLDMMELAMSGIDSTVPVTSRSA